MKSKARKAIEALMEEFPVPMTKYRIAEELHLHINTVYDHLESLRWQEKVSRVGWERLNRRAVGLYQWGKHEEPPRPTYKKAVPSKENRERYNEKRRALRQAEKLRARMTLKGLLGG